jgi:photosystem II stability/assembly factor-like uncharacterized protein
VRRSLYNSVLSRIAVPVANRTNGTVNGTTIDRTDPTGGADNTTVAMFVVASGTVTDGSHAVTVQESDDGSSWAAVPSEYLQGSLPTIVSTDDDKVFEVGYVGTKRYIRAVVTTTGATSGGTFGAVVLLSGGRRTTPNR